ncbi:xylulokinase domain protein [Burkholderia pseudomallei]|nr:xylulokinase domain protein [Burkholderia pseudomallei]
MRAASADSAPHRASGARGVANSVRGKPSEAIRSSSQSPSGPASAVAQASDGSLAMSPPNAARSQSFGCSAQRAARSVSGSCAASHASSGPAMPGDTGFGDAGHRATSAVARASGHSSAGRSALPDAPVSTTPCICPEKPIARTRARSCSGSRVAASTSARHHAATSISAQPGCGVATAYAAPDDARTRPSPSTIASLREPVPRSMPRNRITRHGFE